MKENKIVCNCMQVSEADIERALATLTDIKDVEEEFAKLQEITHCSTGCGGCHDKVMDIIADHLNK